MAGLEIRAPVIVFESQVAENHDNRKEEIGALVRSEGNLSSTDPVKVDVQHVVQG